VFGGKRHLRLWRKTEKTRGRRKIRAKNFEGQGRGDSESHARGGEKGRAGREVRDTLVEEKGGNSSKGGEVFHEGDKTKGERGV